MGWWLQVLFGWPAWPPARTGARLVSLAWLVGLSVALFAASLMLLRAVETRYPLAFALILVVLGAVAKKDDRKKSSEPTSST